MNPEEEFSEKVENNPSQEYSGTFNYMGWKIEFCYWNFNSKLTEELKQVLFEHAQERIETLLKNDDFNQGELNCLNTDNDEEIRGWWKIV